MGWTVQWVTTLLLFIKASLQLEDRKDGRQENPDRQEGRSKTDRQEGRSTGREKGKKELDSNGRGGSCGGGIHTSSSYSQQHHHYYYYLTINLTTTHHHTRDHRRC
jgi:hypothetical protein